MNRSRGGAGVNGEGYNAGRTMDDPPPSRLEYAEPPPPVGRVANARRLVWAAVIVAGVLLFLNRRDLYRAAQLFYYERQALRHLMPSTKVVVEGDPETARWLASSDPAYGLHPDAAIALLASPLWSGLRPHLLTPDVAQDVPAFIHERRDKSGRTCLVVVSAGVRTDVPRVEFRWTCATPARGGPQFPRASGGGMHIRYDHAAQDWIDLREFRLYAGQPDPNDPAGFTIPYRYKKKDGLIRGRVEGGAVALEVESGPLADPGKH